VASNAPGEEIDLVRSWAKTNGASAIHLTRSRDFLTLEFTAKTIKDIFGVEMRTFAHQGSGTSFDRPFP
jgi:hypothetical protein